MLSGKIEKAIREAEKNMSGTPVDSDTYVVGAFDFFGGTLSLSHTRSKSTAEDTVRYYKTLRDVASVIVERPGVGMKMWSLTERSGWRVKEVRAAVAIRLAVAERMSERFEMVADRVAASKWEAPTGGRKYWRLRREDGSYDYRETPPEQRGGAGEEKGKVVQEGAKDRGKKVEKKPAEKTYKHHVVLSKDDLEKTLSKGHFTILSAGLNPKDAKEAKMDPDDEFFHERNRKLRDELEKAGFNYTEATGHYEGEEPSLMVFHEPVDIKRGGGRRSFMVHHESAEELKSRKEKLEELGEKFNQNSVLHGSAGKNTIYFTTGEKKGRECGGKGWNEAPKAKDYYTEMEMENKKRTKFQLDVKECFEKGFFD